MITYPDTAAYVVAFEPGTCGSFIMNLISLFLGSTKLPVYSKNGNAHHYNNFNVRGTPRKSEIDFPDPIHKNQTVIFWIHKISNLSTFSTLFKKYPKAKVLLIQHSLDDLELIQLNMFYKVFIDSWVLWPETQTNWKNIKHHFDNESTPIDITEDKILLGIKSLLKEQSLPDFYVYDEKISIDDSRIHVCKFKDIILNKQKTLQLLSTFTEKSIPEIIENNKVYDNYLESQKKIWEIYKL